MEKQGSSRSEAIRARINFPVIDSDGHAIEFAPALLDFLKEVGGEDMVKRYLGIGSLGLTRVDWFSLTPQERRDRRVARPTWWGVPTKNTLDRVTAALPGLLYERM